MSFFLKNLFLKLVERQEFTENCETYMVALTLFSIKCRRQNEMTSEEMQKIASPQKHNHSFSLSVSVFIAIIQIKFRFISMSNTNEFLFEFTVQAIVKRITENRETFYCLCTTST